MAHPKEEKLKEIYIRTNRQIRKSIFFFFSAVGLFILGVSVPTFLELSPYDYIAAFGILIISLFLFFKYGSTKPSYEKRLFREFFKVYQNFAGYLKITDSSTLTKKNLDFVISPLHKLSRKLRGRSLEGSSDIIAETNQKYAEIGESLQTKIIAHLQKSKDVERVKRRILRLADVFSDASMKQVYSYLESLENVPDEEFQDIPSRLDKIKTGILSNRILKIGVEFAICLGFVTAVAYFLSIVLSIPLADLGGYILVASFALLATWERAGS